VTVGINSSSAALLAGLTFSFIPELFSVYLPASWGEVPPALFGLGAVLVARNPEGTLASNARRIQQFVAQGRSKSPIELLIDQTTDPTTDSLEHSISSMNEGIAK
jgi:branched-chain amino acid transport system permease protein